MKWLAAVAASQKAAYVYLIQYANGMPVFYPDYSSQFGLLTERPWFYSHISLISVSLWKVRSSTRMSTRT
jgi:hypothetical protein